MPINHKAFLLDSLSFSNEITPLIHYIDMGDLEPLFMKVYDTVAEIDKNAWVLNSAGSIIRDEFLPIVDNANTMTAKEAVEYVETHPMEIGYYLLIIFSKYLEKFFGLGLNYSVLSFGLKKIGWKTNDIDLLIKGMPTSILLKPQFRTMPKVLDYSQPYWYWMRPSHSHNHGGWLSLEQIKYLSKKLLQSQKKINKFKPTWFGNYFGMLRITNPEGQIEYLKMLQRSYARALDMLDTAIEKKQDIYMVLTIT